MLAHCVSLLGEVLAARGDYIRAAPLLDEAVALQERLGGQLEAMVVRNMLAGVVAYLGQFAAAVAILAEQLQRSQASGDAAAVASTLGFVGTVAQMKGDLGTAVAYGREAIRRAEEAENLVHQYVPRVFLGLALARSGDVVGGLDVQRPACGLWRTVRSRRDDDHPLLRVLRWCARRAGGVALGPLKFLLDGEEEHESPGLAACIAAHRDRLAADLLVNASGEIHQSGRPTVEFGLRGLDAECARHPGRVRGRGRPQHHPAGSGRRP